MARIDRRTFSIGAGALAAAAVGAARSAGAQAGDPIRIGFGMSLTGPLAANGKSALLAMQIWESDINGKGGLLGRPVKLVFYDDQSNPSTVPGIYSKLLDVDRVELIVGGYATNMVAPAMPIVMERKKLLIGLLALAINSEFKYPRYFSMAPMGPDPKASFTKPFFELIPRLDPRPQTIAIATADAEFGRNLLDGARENVKAAGLKVVYDRTYPPATTDFSPIVRAVQATNPDVFLINAYPLDSVGMVRTVNEIGFKPKLIGGGMVGLQATTIKTQLGPLLNGFTTFDFWLPAKAMQFPGVMELIEKYQARATGEGVDPLGYYMAPWGYAYLQVMAQAIEGTKSIDDGKLADFIRDNTFPTVVGDVRFGKNGEWAEARMLETQFQNVKGNDLAQFRDLSVQKIVAPEAFKSGEVIYPFEKARV